MKPDTLRHFSQQLQSWCAERLNQKPGPFRLAEAFPHLLGCKDSLYPPITLWINRESCLAGGIILLPSKDEIDCFDEGLDITEALGLSHFHTWGRNEISCWSVEQNAPEKIWEYELPREEVVSPSAFRQGFNLLVDQMEQIFFDRQQIPVVSGSYLSNLVHTTFIDLLPEIQKALQIDPSTTGSDSVKIRNLLFRTLLLPIGLVGSGQSLHGTTPDTIIETLTSSVEKLPLSLQQPFSFRVIASDFPAECQRRLHHYCCRIERLAQQISPIIAPSTERLLQEYAASLGGHPLPERSTDLRQVVMNSDRLDLNTPAEIEIGEAGILAATALIRYFPINGATSSPQQLPTPFDLNEILVGHQIIGTLFDTRIPKAAAQKELNIHLRTSWPNRKLALTGKTPIWAWGFLHLCGLAGKNSRLDLAIPAEWLWENYGEKLISTLVDTLDFMLAKPIDSGHLVCTFKPKGEETFLSIETADGETRTVSHEPTSSLRTRTILALNLPEEIFNLIDSGQLQLYSEEQIRELPHEGLGNFLNSTLGKGLWKLLSASRTRPKTKLYQELARRNMPLPSNKIITELGRLKSRDGLISQADIDHELSVWFGASLPEITFNKRSKHQAETTEKKATAGQYEQLFHLCQAEEIPVFPDNYLYNIPVTERISYSFSGQLAISSSFFDQVTLVGPDQQELKVAGIEQANALILTSSIRSGPIELPRENSATADMINRYRRDLLKLRQSFIRLAAGAFPDSDITTIVSRIWKQLPLPDLALLTDE